MKKIIYLLLAIIFIVGCKKPYTPPAINSGGSYLVVEGVINSGTDSTVITLSKTVNISSNTTVNPVLNATVTVESNQNSSFALTSAGNGQYFAAGLNLNNAYQYRLRIVTPNDTYLSDFVPVLNSPPLDSISYQFTSTGINIYSNTHDPNNIVKYYRWGYGETWLFNSNYQAHYYIANSDTILPLPSNRQIYFCWASDTSSTILLGSTARLSKAVVVNNPITIVPRTSVKIQRGYSILVRQYALTADAYTFWSELKKNTEQLGSIFDAQPSQVTGNIHSVTNPSEPVIGYISVGTTSSARILIRAQQLPASWPAVPPIDSCTEISALYNYYNPKTGVTTNQVNDLIIHGTIYPVIPIEAIYVQNVLVGFTAAAPECVDCTLHGTNVQPPYWQY